MSRPQNNIIDHKNMTLLHDAAVGFLTNCAMLDKIQNEEPKDLLCWFRLNTPYHCCLLISIELFLKVFLLNEGKRLNKLKTHKIYDLFKKLKPETQDLLNKAVNGDGRTHYYKLEDMLIDNNNKLVRFRYNDLTQSACLDFNGGDVLIHLALVLCHKTGTKIMLNGKEWKPYN